MENIDHFIPMEQGENNVPSQANTGGTIVIRTGECDGMYIMQAYQKVQISSYGYNPESIQTFVTTINSLLLESK